MERNLNTYLEDIDLQFWHDLIKMHGNLVTFEEGEYVCHHGEKSSVFGYVQSGNFCIEIEGSDQKKHIIDNVFPDSLIGNYPDCMYYGVSHFDIKAVDKSSVYLMDARVLLSLYNQDSHIENQGRLLIEAMLKSLTKCYADIVLNGIVSM
ncbi:MAG: cyclic nucleotide-binding domain-containing protein [Muribaculaceae bacterium]|nr:cyclic nucleotide-binding domain-containing protein [Muribaculaceae bacterium]